MFSAVRTPGAARPPLKRTPAPRPSAPSYQSATQMPSFIRQAHHTDLRRTIAAAFRLDSPLAAQCLLAGKNPSATDAQIDSVLQWIWAWFKRPSLEAEPAPPDPRLHPWKLSLQALAEIHQSFLLPIETLSTAMQDATTKGKCKIELSSLDLSQAIARIKSPEVVWLSAQTIKDLESRRQNRWRAPSIMNALVHSWTQEATTAARGFVCCFFVLDETIQWLRKRLEFEKAGGVNSSGCTDYLKGARIGREEEFVLTDEQSLLTCTLAKYGEIRNLEVPECVLEMLVSDRLVVQFGCMKVDQWMLVPIGATSVSYFVKHQLLGGRAGAGGKMVKDRIRALASRG